MPVAVEKTRRADHEWTRLPLSAARARSSQALLTH